MNSGQSNTRLNDMLTEFVDYVDSFYGVTDPLYPMMSRETGQPLNKHDIYGATQNYLSMCSDDRVKNWVDLAIRIEGTNKTYGVHAAGVVISSEPLDSLVPLQRNNDGQIITQYSMDEY